ncbi:MAG: hypothetical protein JNM99_08190 [Verrucomicrobiaceae bacterium]|nr:hypothetical protein [Verrucomicrobiaceae bacterium]
MSSSVNLIAIEWRQGSYRVLGEVPVSISFHKVRETGRMHEVDRKMAADYRDDIAILDRSDLLAFADDRAAMEAYLPSITAQFFLLHRYEWESGFD